MGKHRSAPPIAQPGPTGPTGTVPARTVPVPVGVAVLAVVGLLVVFYPTMASWFTARSQEAAVEGYLDEVESTPLAVKQEALARAREYNEAIPQILLTDPYTVEDARAGRGGAYRTYLEQLAVERVSIMGRVTIASIGVDLPIRHGTDEQTLQSGAGHLFGSSLPVGGPGTHSVLTAHSGLVTATMFDHLEDVQVGAIVGIEVLGQTLRYRVTSTEVVEPTEVAALQREPRRDQLTLVTCTPTGVNTHRLLVHADRVPDDPAGPGDRTPLAAEGLSAGFPWWLPTLVAGSTGLVLLVLLLGRPSARARSGGAERDE